MSITTTYRGIEYRSRLEAKWAAFFTQIGWKFTYEPFDGDGYIPDFLIHGDQPLLVEVKPAATRGQYEAAITKSVQGLAAHWEYDLLIVGADPLPPWTNSWGPHGAEDDTPSGYSDVGFPPAGLLGEYDGEGWDFDTANWLRCRTCNKTAVIHDSLTWMSRPCGHYDGDQHLGTLSISSIESLWATASNDVKWRGRGAA